MTATRINAPARQLARGLGWFSLALGAAELLAPGSIKSNTGLPGPKALVRAYGAREIAAGLAILCSRRPVGMVWMRVGGDLLDLTTAAPALRAQNPHRPAAEAAFGFLVLATIADFVVAMQGDDVEVTPPDLSGRPLQARPDDLPAANLLPGPVAGRTGESVHG